MRNYFIMKKFYIDEYNKNELIIYMLLTSKCQLNCFYCCAKESPDYYNVLKDKDGKYNSLNKEQVDLILRSISKTNFDVTLNLLGGEPTLSPYLNYIIKESEALSNVKSIELGTNGITDLSKIDFRDKLRVLFTYHPSEMNSKLELKFLKNLEICRKKNAEFLVNIMIPRDKKYKEKIQRFISKLKILNIRNIAPSYPYQDISNMNESFLEIDNIIKPYILNSKRYSLFDVFKQKLNRFKGWKCENTSYIIGINGDIQQCSNRVLGNIYNDEDFFEKINPTCICPYEKCNYEGFLRSLKYEDIE